MQNFDFLPESGMFKRAQSLFMMKSLFIKSFSVYVLRVTEMATDTPA